MNSQLVESGFVNIDSILSIENPVIARAEFSRQARFEVEKHKIGYTVAKKLIYRKSRGLNYHRPLLPLMTGNSQLSGFMEGLVPLKPLTTEDEAEAMKMTFVELDCAVNELAIPEMLGSKRFSKKFRGRLNYVLGICEAPARITSVEPVFSEEQLTEKERNFAMPVRLPGVRVDLEMA